MLGTTACVYTKECVVSNCHLKIFPLFKSHTHAQVSSVETPAFFNSNLSQTYFLSHICGQEGGRGDLMRVHLLLKKQSWNDFLKIQVVNFFCSGSCSRTVSILQNAVELVLELFVSLLSERKTPSENSTSPTNHRVYKVCWLRNLFSLIAPIFSETHGNSEHVSAKIEHQVFRRNNLQFQQIQKKFNKTLSVLEYEKWSRKKLPNHRWCGQTCSHEEWKLAW